MEKIIQLLKKNKSIILYLFFGVCTTAVNFIAYFVCRKFGLSVAVSNIISWILSVLFAYVTNRKYVFESKNNTAYSVFREFGSFVSCRIATGIMDLIIMFVSVEILNFNEPLMKIISNVLVIVLNYVASKLVIFKK